MIKTNLTSVILLQYFTLFPEYFISICILYILIVGVVLTYSVYGLSFQRALSECIALILLMTCYLIFNDDLITLNEVVFHNAIITDYLAYSSKLLICFFSSMYFLLISSSLKEQKLASFEYLLVVMFSILGFMIMCSSNDLLTAYLSIELASLSSYILASFKKTSIYSVESGLKYFITGAVSSSFFLLGSSLLYAFSGSICFDDFLTLYESNQIDYVHRALNPFIYVHSFQDILNVDVRLLFIWLNPFWATISLPSNDPFFRPFDHSFIEVGYSFIMFSLFIKLAVAPFHLWSLDVYEGSPTSSSFFFAVIGKLSIFVLLIRICYINFHYAWDGASFYSIYAGITSVFVGSFGGLKQKRLKTLLAYSSITSMGYGLLGLGTMEHLGIQMLFFHLIIYMLSGLCTWSIFLLLRLKTKRSSDKYNKELSDLALLRKSNPALAFALSLTMFSVAGIPPLVGFLAKLGIFIGLVRADHTFIALISAVLSVVGTFYYIRVIKVIYFENVLVGKLYHPITTSKTLITSILVFLQLYLFINPSILYFWCYRIVPEDLFEYL